MPRARDTCRSRDFPAPIFALVQKRSPMARARARSARNGAKTPLSLVQLIQDIIRRHFLGLLRNFPRGGL